MTAACVAPKTPSFGSSHELIVIEPHSILDFLVDFALGLGGVLFSQFLPQSRHQNVDFRLCVICRLVPSLTFVSQYPLALLLLTPRVLQS